MKHLFCVLLIASFATLEGELAAFVAPDRKPIGESNLPNKFTNAVGMEFVWIPPGVFLMGSPANEQHREQGEIQHKVTLTKGFYMGVHLVTQEQWQTVMGNNPSGFKGEKN